MTNNRDKGKRGERYFAAKLKNIFPDIKRNQAEQADEGGVDLVNTGCFDFEVKHGKMYKSMMIRRAINQVQKEGKELNWKCVLVKPHMEKSYAVIPFKDFVEILKAMKSEGII